MSRAVYITAARRSIVVPRGGALAHLAPHQLAAPVLQSALTDAQLSGDQIDEVICGNALGAGGNPARLVALEAGLPERVAGLSIDRQCCSGLDALLLGQALIAAGQADIIIAGGVESYSQRPYRAHQSLDGSKKAYDQPAFTPWPERDPKMAKAADDLAVKSAIDRSSQDLWAAQSHAKALEGRAHMTAEICQFDNGLPQADSYSRVLSHQLCARANVICGSITHANTAVAADAAAFCVLTAQTRSNTPAVQLLGGATIGGDPSLPGLAPIAAIKRVLQHHKISVAEVDQAEIMEAFAVQALACINGAGLDPARVNRHGGALARGHPIGASGAILAVRLFHDLRVKGGTGLAAIAAAGGLGTAALLQAK
ncbi:MAG: thiolase family protein [Paracoccaceae bacterium]|jgi:acetyl-CoA C-acetyltransferase|nr:thiolase family protein [Paracoccaceae bacterium]